MKLTITSPAGSVFFDATKRETTIGRETTCDWVIPSDRLSRNHCVFYNLTDRFSIMDPGSKNGIMVDGVRIEANQMIPVTNSSIIILANEYFLSFGKTQKLGMIESHKPPPPKLRPKRVKEVEEKDPMSFKSVFRTIFITGLFLALLFTVGIYFLMYK